MGLFRRIISRITGGLVSPEPPRRSRAPEPPSYERDTSHTSGWGVGFGASHEVDTVSNDGYDFSWHVAGWKPIGGTREDLEDQPNRVLTDKELSNADYLVVHFSGPIGYVVIGGTWDSWDDVFDDVAARYDEGES